MENMHGFKLIKSMGHESSNFGPGFNSLKNFFTELGIIFTRLGICKSHTKTLGKVKRLLRDRCHCME